MADFAPSEKYLIRILKILAEKRKIGVSAIASESRMNQKRCNEHLSWLEKKGLIEFDNDGKTKVVVIKEKALDAVPNLRILLPCFAFLVLLGPTSLGTGTLN